MKKAKKVFLSIIAAALCVLSMLSVAPSASALSKPKAPKSVKYISDYAVQEHCLTFKPSSGGATGYHVQVVNASGKVTSNQYYKSTRKDKVFYKLGDEYVVWCNNNFNKYIANGQFYTVKVRAFNASNYKSGKPSSAKYSGFASTYAAETVTGAKAQRVKSPKGIKFSWNKTKGATGYELRFMSLDKKDVYETHKVKGASATFTRISGVYLDRVKTVHLQIIPVKASGKKTYTGAVWKYFKLNVK